MKTIVAGLMLMLSMSVWAQSPLYNVSTDEKNGSIVFNGPITFNDLNSEATFTWLKSGRVAYSPNKKKIEYLDQNLKNFSMVVFLGTWCGDSKDLIPELEKVLDLTGYPKSQITMYGVDREKKTKNGEEGKYEIRYVPTIILLDNGKEIGRVTETVKKSIEADLARIIKTNNK